ncbi:isoprenoid synthase domain-containing protein [Rhodocollybia butyracea]|uniref:Isoprenoid synthase domain-containing protein n=1 Tax=Rhodocollybia butyracea TaxID=206335 RepID=A0A9P5PSH6_9AGAR|nr:isoprenoid synthase domain-containing protein [Rhodocollybia butyracea]
MAPFTAQSIDTTDVTSYFSSLPVKSCQLDAQVTIDEALRSTIQSCTVPNARERKKAEYRHNNPAGNIFGLCLPMSEKERLKYAVQFIEFLCIVDGKYLVVISIELSVDPLALDTMEDLPLGEACIEHAILRQALYKKYDENEYAGQLVGGMTMFLRNIRLELADQNDPESLALLAALDSSLHHRNSVEGKFETLESYIPYRKTTSDYNFVCNLIRWTMKIPLQLGEKEELLARKHEHVVGVIASLTNDYFSWQMERQPSTDRVRNAVPILMKEHNLSDEKARTLLKGIIVNEEEKMRKFNVEIDTRKDISEDLKNYTNALGLFAAGYSFCRPQTEEDFATPN